ncbi:MAG: helix-turn-helix transcriptional regulator [Anaerolineales bacterium]|nr:helix-turn-helix transcriptional regulator [Anaerolineales bacterium]
MNRFGEKLRTLRNEHKITLLQLAQEFGYTSHSYLSEIEYGYKMPTVALVLKVSRFFDVSTDSLLKDEMDLDLKPKHFEK